MAFALYGIVPRAQSSKNGPGNEDTTRQRARTARALGVADVIWGWLSVPPFLLDYTDTALSDPAKDPDKK